MIETRFKFIDDDKKLSQEEKDHYQEKTRTSLGVLAQILHYEMQAREAPNFFAVSFDVANGDLYYLTYQKSNGENVLGRIRELQEENEKLKKQLSKTSCALCNFIGCAGACWK